MNQSILSYEEFVSYIRENVEDGLENTGISGVSVTEVVKNNGVVFDTLTIEQEEGDYAPVFYLKDLYGRYLQGESEDVLAEQIIYFYRNHAEKQWDLEYQWFLHLENVYERIIMKAVNYEKNKVQLENCPHIRELDLALTFRILMEKDEEQIGTILVNNEMMREWETSEFDLFDLAVKNMQRLWQPTLEPIQDILEGLIQMESDEKEIEYLKNYPVSWDLSMYVLTNDLRLNGATILFYTDCLRQFASRIKKDIFVLPSSIHEVLLVPIADEMSAWDLRQIVEQVNHQLVSEEEVLSNHVYRYLYKEDKLIIGA
ncbi:MAG: DUF5688 family protein [Coprococcus sp.]